MSSKDRVLHLLELAKGSPVSGETMAQHLFISRAAVWRAIQELRSEGHVIRSSTRVGYTLESFSAIVTKQSILAALQMPELTLHYHQQIDSTNKEAKRLALEGAASATVVVADSQSQGIGRNGKSFYSPPRSGVYISMLLRPSYNLQTALRITGATAVAACKAVKECLQQELSIKWVNDLYKGKLKVGGILTEGVSGFENGKIETIVVGIGLNVFPPQGGFPSDLHDKAGALCPVGQKVDRSALIASVIKHMSECAATLETSDYLEEYRRRSLVLGRSIEVIQGQKSFIATAVKIDDEGALVVQLADGSTTVLQSGEISIRPADKNNLWG
jgi:BirA family biotin operon repressor/biotin-[acetyl-CoA-carboxylase] ligase